MTPALQRQRQMDLSEFKTSLVHIMSSRIARNKQKVALLLLVFFS